jgi:predicted  nucleic acid-binding Zn-ribbon protein
LEDKKSTASENAGKVSDAATEVAKCKNEYTGYVEDIQTMYNNAMDDDSGDETANNEAAMKLAIAAQQEFKNAAGLLKDSSELMEKVKGLFDDCRDQSHWANEFTKDASTLLEEAELVEAKATDTTMDYTLAELKAFLPVVEYLLESGVAA